MTDRHSNWTGVAFGLAIACYAAYQQFKLPPALPLMLESYGYAPALAGSFMSAYALAGLALSFLLGRVIAERGSTRPLVAALALMTAGSVATLVVPESGLTVLLSRTVEGIGFAILSIAGPVLANRCAGPRHLPLVIAGTATWIPVGQLVAAGAARPGLALFGWSSLWWLGLAMTAGLGLWLAAIRRRGGVPLDRSERTRERRASARLDPRQRLSMLLAASVFMLWSSQYFAYMTWLPEYLVSELGLTVDGAILGYAFPVTMLLISIFATGAALRRGVPVGRLLVGGMVVQLMSWILLPVAGDGLAGVGALAVYGASAGVVPTSLFAMPATIAGQGAASATAFGIMMTGRNSGVLVGPLLLALVFERTGGWTWSAPLLGTITAVALVLATLLMRRLQGTSR